MLIRQLLHGFFLDVYKRQVQDILMNPRFRIYVTDDIVGVELGGALKNVVALAAGVCDGLDVGDNTKACLLYTSRCV